MPFASIARVNPSREREKSMKKVVMTASEIGCSIVVKDMASTRSLLSFLKGKGLIKDFQVYAVDFQIGEAKCMEISFTDNVFDEAVTIEGKISTVIVPAEYKEVFKGIVP
jgi:hypothetical protein